MSKLLLSLSLIFMGLKSHAQLLQKFNFTGAAGNELTLPPDGQPTNGQLSNIRRGSGINPSAGANTFAALGFTTGPAVDTADYFEFSIGSATGYFLNLDSVVIGERKSGTGITKWSVRSSLDGFTTDLSTFDVPAASTATRYNQNTTLGITFKDLPSSTPVAFRFFGYAAGSATGTWRLDSIRIHGTIANTPTSTLPELSNGSFAVYPNPGNQSLFIDRLSLSPSPIHIFDATGQRKATLQATENQYELDTHTWKSGLYLISGNGYTLRWVKQ